MTTALLISDVQNDFTSKASDGSRVAGEISEYAQANRHHYDYIIASRDWHDGHHDNGGHFPPTSSPGSLPWIAHCVAGSRGADYDSRLTTSIIDVHVKKGQGFPGYSVFEGTTDEGVPFTRRVRELGITAIDVVGIATEGCVAAAAQGGVGLGLRSRVLLELCRGFDAARVSRRLHELRSVGVEIVDAGSCNGRYCST